MKFLLEINNPEMNVETFLWKDLLDDKRCLHTYDTCTYEELPTYISHHPCNMMVPLGSIIFTNRFFQLVYNIQKMNPVEIPPCLREQQFLGRQYQILTGDKLPTEGYYFIKDASSFKEMAYLGPLSHIDREKLHTDRPYVLSSPVEIIAEYRVYFIRGKVYGIEYYNGNPAIFPDYSTIAQANLRYSKQADYPKSYTMDVMVTQDGTFITEIHPVLFSCGIYTTVLGADFLDGYIDSLHYILKHNTPITLT